MAHINFVCFCIVTILIGNLNGSDNEKKATEEEFIPTHEWQIVRDGMFNRNAFNPHI